jgi:1-phosphatidylinositol-4-phosphate 5-kinase
VWRNGYLFCQGVKRYSCGTTYHGEFNQDQEREGYGILTFSSGEVYEGEWKANSINGFGSWSSTDGRSFIGIWNNGIPCGNGIYTMTPDQTQPCTGTFKMGVLEPCGSFVIERLEIPM